MGSMLLNSCLHGEYVVDTRLHTIDINECEISNGGCDQNCINLPGGYKCSCFDGSDRSTCESKLLYQVRTTTPITAVSLNSSSKLPSFLVPLYLSLHE